MSSRKMEFVVAVGILVGIMLIANAEISAAAEGELENPKCPGGKASCNVGQTCCSILGGAFGCCPYDNGVCCSDQKSCCPQGTACKYTVYGTTCAKSKPEKAKPKNKYTLPKYSPLKPALVQLDYPVGGNQTESLEENGINGGTKYCPDGRTICASTVPCCFHAGGAYGCCPYPYGICCADLVSCCPYGTRCNIQAHTCEII